MNAARMATTPMATRPQERVDPGALADASPTCLDPFTPPSNRDRLLDSLRRQIRHLETAQRCDDGRVSSTGCAMLDRLLPEGGLSAGTITEWLAPHGGSGAEVLSLVAAREACQAGGALVIIDGQRRFYPPAAAAWGINLDHTIVLRSQSQQALYWGMDQALRCAAVAVVWGSVDHINARWQRRFQLSAEESGARGMFIRPAHVQGQPSWCDVQWMVGRKPGAEPRTEGNGRRVPAQPTESLPARHLCPGAFETGQDTFARCIPLQLLRCRGGKAGAQVTLEIDFHTGQIEFANDDLTRETLPTAGRTHEKHSLHLATQLAHPTARRCSARA